MIIDKIIAKVVQYSLSAAIAKDLEPMVERFLAMRVSEGAAMFTVLSGQLNEIETLVGAAAGLLEARRAELATNLRTALARVMENADGVDENRLAQELAVLAVKTDVTEEIDRLNAHIVAARDLLAKGGPLGRKLDFLSQEFNREANTLCSKAQSKDLTRIGLDLKTVIDQMREQVQNVE